MKVKVGHSPDPDDAFMFYPIKYKLIDLRGYEVEEVVEDIERLNEMAMKRELDVTAISAHAYAYVWRDYTILSSGASMGLKYGPVVVAREKISLDGRRVAIPGKYTTAALLLRIFFDNVKTVEMRFDKIPEAVLKGEVDAGVLIHEEQIAYQRRGLVKIADLGELWYEETRLPTPLGIDVARDEIARDWARIWRDAVEYSLRHPKEALKHAIPFSRLDDEELIERFVRMYVNEYTLDMGEEGERALRKLFEVASEKGLIPEVEVKVARP